MYEKLDFYQEKKVIRRNTAVLFQRNLNQPEYPKFKNFCEHCTGLLNTPKQNWLFFSFPTHDWENNLWNDILVCRVCFSFLAERHFKKIGNTEKEYK